MTDSDRFARLSPRVRVHTQVRTHTADLAPPVTTEKIDLNVKEFFMTNTTILVLDLGTTTGWVLHQLDGNLVSGSEHFKLPYFDGAL